MNEKQYIIKVDLSKSTHLVQRSAKSSNALKVIVDLYKRLLDVTEKACDKYNNETSLIRIDGDGAWLTCKQKFDISKLISEIFHQAYQHNQSRVHGYDNHLNLRISIDFDEIKFITRADNGHIQEKNFLSYGAILCSRIEEKILSEMVGATPRAFSQFPSQFKVHFGPPCLIEGKNKLENGISAHICKYDIEKNAFSKVENLAPGHILSHTEGTQVESCVLHGLENIQKATKFILKNSNSFFSQSHLLSNTIPEKDDLFIKSMVENSKSEFDTYKRVIGVSDNNDLEFLVRSLRYANAPNKIKNFKTIVKALNTISLSNQTDTLPNFVTSEKHCLISFPSKSEKGTFALFSDDKRFVQKMSTWFNSFVSTMPTGEQYQEQSGKLFTKYGAETIEWVLKTIAWRMHSKHATNIKNISIIGSYCDKNTRVKANDIDLLIVFKKCNTEIAKETINFLKETCHFFSNDLIKLCLNTMEGPIYDESNYDGKKHLLHTLICDTKTIGNWPSQIRRSRFYKNINYYGNLKKTIGNNIEQNIQDYFSLDFGFDGLISALKNECISYKEWTESGRTNVIYLIDSSYKKCFFSIYAIIRSTTNLLDLLNPHLLETTGDDTSILHAKCKNISHGIGKTFCETLDISDELKKRAIQPNYEIASKLQSKAISHIEDIKEYYKFHKNDKI